MAKNYISVKLSSKWTDVGYYGLWVILLTVMPLLLYMSFSSYEGINWGVLAISILLFALIIFCLIFIAKGHIKDNVIYLKKYMKPEVSYPIEQIKDVKIYETRRDSYIILTIGDNDKSEKFLLVTTRVFYAGEVRNTEEVLKEIVAQNKSKK